MKITNQVRIVKREMTGRTAVKGIQVNPSKARVFLRKTKTKKMEKTNHQPTNMKEDSLKKSSMMMRTMMTTYFLVMITMDLIAKTKMINQTLNNRITSLKRSKHFYKNQNQMTYNLLL